MNPRILVLPGLIAAAMGGCDRAPVPGSPGRDSGSPSGSARARIVAGSPAGWAANLPVLTAAPDLVANPDDLEDGDLVLFITEHAPLEEGGIRLIAEATYLGETVGFEVRVLSGWKTSAVVAMGSGRVELRSIGERSDRFIAALEDVYGTSVAPEGMRDEIELAGMSLEGDPTDLAATAVVFKLFFEEQEDYAEFFLNISLATRRVMIREKDPEYRDAVVRGLGNV